MSTAARLSGLRGLIRERAPAERCELCSAELSPHPNHEHLFEPSSRQIHCSCTPCAILFPADVEKRYRRVSRRLVYLQDFAMDDMQWESLAIPVNMAFLHTSTSGGGVRAFYPSPAGATESMLSLEGWSQLVADNELLESLEPDVEALLINRVSGARDHYIAPIDRCFELVGLIRISWRGLSGGQEVWERIDTFFSDLRSAARVKVRSSA
jgi:Family of unknown function (DUF5947)